MKRILYFFALAAFVAVPATAAEVRTDAPTSKWPSVSSVDEKKLTTLLERLDTQAFLEQDIATQIASVVVFPEGARVTRSAPIKLRAGEQTLVLTGVPQNIRESSLTAETQIPGVRVTAVSSSVDYTKVRDESAVAAAREKYEQLLARDRDLHARLSYVRKQWDKLTAFKPESFSKDQKPKFYIQTAEGTLAFLETELAKLSDEILRLEAEAEQLDLDRAIAESEYQKISAYAQPATRTVTVKIIADAPVQTGTLELNYMMKDARWWPSYDLRVDPASKTATLVSYGVVSQRTGEDWSNVPVSLSTARPNVSADLPEFKKIVVTERYAPPITAKYKSSSMPTLAGAPLARNVAEDYAEAEECAVAETPARAQGRKRAASKQKQSQLVLNNSSANSILLVGTEGYRPNVQDIRFQNGNYIFKNADGVFEKVSADQVIRISQNYVEADQGDIPMARLRNPAQDLRGLDFRYNLARRETIKSTGTPHRYLLASEKYAGDFYYQLVPSVNSHAYQMLSVTNANFRPILAGPANIFYGADFIGDMDVPYTLRNGKVTIPLGVDPRVFVERQKLNNIETVGVLTSSRRNTVEVKTKIVNRTPEKIRIVCDESIPLSRSEKIEVSTPKFSPKATSFNKETGQVRWSETLAPAQELELRASYEIDYPTDFALEEIKR